MTGGRSGSNCSTMNTYVNSTKPTKYTRTTLLDTTLINSFLFFLKSFTKRYRESYRIAALNRPLGLQKVGVPRISSQSAHEGGKV
jgi:hypothetical protein